MATTAYTTVNSDDATGTRGIVVQWLSVPNGNQGQSFDAKFYADKTVQIAGTSTFGAGGSVTWEGSNVPTPGASDWETLHATDGTPLTFTVRGMKTVLEHVMHMRPNVTAGDGTTALDCYVFAGTSARR